MTCTELVPSEAANLLAVWHLQFAVSTLFLLIKKNVSFFKEMPLDFQSSLIIHQRIKTQSGCLVFPLKMVE